MPLPTIFESTVLEPPRKWLCMFLPSRFIKPIHPKTMIAPEEAAIRKVIDAGWWGQPKMHGHRAQIHVSGDLSQPCFVYNRQGQRHRETLTSEMEDELRRLFAPDEKSLWSAIDAEWLKPEKQIYVFDILKYKGVILDQWSYAQRYELIPRLYLSPYIYTLPVFKTVERCMAYLTSELAPNVEGLVFRAASSLGFSDSTIVRCRR